MMEGGEIITFYIKSPNPEHPILSRQAEKGMTWGEWIESDYNLRYDDELDNGFENQYFEILGDIISHYDDGWYVAYPQDDYARPNDIIIDNFTYGNDIYYL